MYYSDEQNRWFNTDDVTLHASGAEGAGGNGPAVEIGDRGTARLLLDVTGSDGDGTETLDVTVETSHDGVTWRTVDTFTQAGAAPASERKSFAGLDRFVRVTWAIAGGGAGFTQYTFEVSGEAV